jgi:hypothetical protein
MTSHRKISLTTALLAAFVAVAPACASANSLLSGYGGPGAGNQAILGSTLIGGGGSAGGGGSSGSGGPTGSTDASSGAATAVAGTGEAGSASAGASERGVVAAARGGGAGGKGAGGQSASGATGSRRGHGKASGGAAHAYSVTPLDDVSKPASVGSGALGFSAADLGYLLLALAVLGATGVITRRLVGASTRPEGLR